MYKIPPNFPIDRFAGSIISQVCIGENEIIFRTSNDILINASDSFRTSIGRNSNIYSVRSLRRYAANLVGKKIEFAEVEDSRNIVLNMSDGTCMVVMGENDHYESYTVEFGAEKYVV
jgi:hypothetical protein